MATRLADTKLPRVKLGVGIGQGATYSDLVSMFKAATCCPVYALPTIAKSQWEFGGPIPTSEVNQFLGPTINLLGQAPNAVNEYQTQGLINGEFQTYILTCAIGVHLEPEPLCWTAQGNAFNVPSSSQAMPNSPDNYTLTDQSNLVYGGGTQSAPQVLASLRRAVCEWGWWSNYGFWQMVRGYNLLWSYGRSLNIINEQLRDTAYTPPNAQNGSASSSQVAICDFVNRMNGYYVGAPMNAGKIFLWQNLVRVGTLAATTTSVNTTGKFRPFDDVLVDATYGGMDLRSKLKGNSEFRTLETPYILKPGVPPGLLFESNNDIDAGTNFRASFDASGGTGQNTVPYYVTSNNALISTGGGASFDEYTVDGVDTLNSVNTEHYVFKGGGAYMSVEVKGYEITETLVDRIKSDSVLQAQIQCECGVGVGWSQG
jgi:hypothetical protein